MSVSGVAASIVTQTNYPVLVNGYMCFSAADVEAARKFTSPRGKDEAAPTSAATKTTRPSESEIRKIQEEIVASAQSEDKPQDSNWPLKEGERGTIVNIVV